MLGGEQNEKIKHASAKSINDVFLRPAEFLVCWGSKGDDIYPWQGGQSKASPSDSSGAHFSQGQTPRSCSSAIYIPSSQGPIDFGLTTWHVALGTPSSGSCGFFRATDTAPWGRGSGGSEHSDGF